MEWEVYIILASNENLYTGIAKCVKTRFYQHLEGNNGAKFFRGNPPISVMYREKCSNRSSASKREWEIKQYSRKQKLLLIENYFRSHNYHDSH